MHFNEGKKKNHKTRKKILERAKENKIKNQNQLIYHKQSNAEHKRLTQASYYPSEHNKVDRYPQFFYLVKYLRNSNSVESGGIAIFSRKESLYQQSFFILTKHNGNNTQHRSSGLESSHYSQDETSQTKHCLTNQIHNTFHDKIHKQHKLHIPSNYLVISIAFLLQIVIENIFLAR